MAQLSLQCACVHGCRPDDGLAFIITTFAEFKVASALQHVGLGACTGIGFPLNFGSSPDQGVDVSTYAGLVGISPSRDLFSLGYGQSGQWT